MRIRIVTVALVSWVCAAAGQAEELSARLEPERTHLLAGSKVSLGVMLFLKAPETEELGSPTTVDLSLVLDQSNSMGEAGKMEMVHIAGAELLNHLEGGDRLGLVAYSSEADVLRPLSAITDSEGVKKMIQGLLLKDWTNMGAGMQEGIGLFGDRRRDGTVRRLLVLTDGNTNKGETDPKVLAEWAREAFIKGTRISTIGLGQDYNEKLLTDIAHAGGGEFYYVTKRDELPELFRKELQEGRHVVVEDLLLTIRVRGGCQFKEIRGYPATGGDEAAREVKIGDLFAKEQVPLLMRFRLEAPAAGEWEAAIVEIVYRDEEGRTQKISRPLVFNVTHSETEVLGSVNQAVRARVIEVDNYAILDKAMDLFKTGDKDKALEEIKKAEAVLNNDAAAVGDKRLLEQAGQLAQARREMEQAHDDRSCMLYYKQMGAFGSRKGAGRLSGRQSARAGGSAGSESAVEQGQDWLVKQQQADGSWDPAGFGGRPEDRQRATSLVLLSYLAAGHTERHGKYRKNVASAVRWLLSRQQADGCIGAAGKMPDDPLARFRRAYDHALAALTLAEAAGMGKEAATTQAAQKAVDWLAAERPLHRLKSFPRPAPASTDDDVAGVAWCVLAMKSARVAGLKVPHEWGIEAMAYLESRELETQGEKTQRFAFFGQEARLLDTMVGNVARQFLGYRISGTIKGVFWCLKQPKGLPEWDDKGGNFDWHYAYFGNLATFQLGGEFWTQWNDVLRDLLIQKQNAKDAKLKGSWAAVGTMKGRDRITATAIARLCLAVYYRYLPIYR